MKKILLSPVVFLVIPMIVFGKTYEFSDFEIYLDGAITKERIEKWSQEGVKGFVLGTATLFNKEENYESKILA